MSVLYPQARDVFRRVNDTADECHAQLFQALYDSVIAIQTELGVKPSGPYGSIYGRLFGTELVSKTTGYWRKLYTQIVTAYDDFLRGSTDFPTIVTWPANRMDGTTTALGEDTPFIFLVYQGRGSGSSFYEASGNAYRQPWYLHPYNVQKTRGFVAGVGADQAAPGNLHLPAQIGVIAWGLQPSPVRTIEDEL